MINDGSNAYKYGSTRHNLKYPKLRSADKKSRTVDRKGLLFNNVITRNCSQFIYDQVDLGDELCLRWSWNFGNPNKRWIMFTCSIGI